MKDEWGYIVVVPEENDIVIRYLFNYSSNANYQGFHLNSFDINFEDHYNNYMNQL
jgi:hypothetical protein